METNKTYVGATGLGMLAMEFESVGSLANLRSANLARQFGAIAVEHVRAHAQGRPGPNVILGNYLASIASGSISGAGGIARVDVGSNADQAMRLEFGFVGVDSRGRHYNQGPFPHFGPAMDELEVLWEEYMTSLIDLDSAYSGLAQVAAATLSMLSGGL